MDKEIAIGIARGVSLAQDNWIATTTAKVTAQVTAVVTQEVTANVNAQYAQMQVDMEAEMHRLEALLEEKKGHCEEAEGDLEVGAPAPRFCVHVCACMRDVYNS
jgi:hypothetical protein